MGEATTKNGMRHFDLRPPPAGPRRRQLDPGERQERDSERLAHDERYQLLFTDSPSPKLVCDRQTLRILDANDATLRLYGYSREELLALTLYDLDGDRERLRKSFESVADDYVELGEWTHETKTKTHVEVKLLAHRLKASQPAFLVVIQDVTEARRLTEQLVQSQKMEAIGRLSGGIAHDFNNMLTAIFAHVELCLESGAAHGPLREDLEAIRSAAERAFALTNQLLAFSRKQVMRTRPVDLGAAVTEIEKMLRHVIGEDVELVTVLEPGLGAVRADPSHIVQVILNLAVNARDAMPLGGRLTIETQNVVLDAFHAKALGELPDGSYVRLTITDTGLGMDDVTKHRIFEPFFTTKPVGKGTGLGLSTVFGIVKQSGGAISVDSSPGKGATFRIYLPQIDAAVPVATDTRAPTSVRGAGRLLLVEDDVQVQRAMLRLLEARGFDAIAVSSKAEALSFLAGEHDPIALMITDVVMPGGDGVSLAKEARMKMPGLRVLFMSGYTEHAMLEDLQQPGTLFMAKPFLGNELDRALKALLGTGDDVGPASPAT